MKCFVYIIKCKDNSYYTGITWNIAKRTEEHNLRIKSCLQKSKVPVSLVYSEEFESRIEAAKREKEIKGWSRKKKEILISSLH
jgi:putative endonuclease